MPSVNWDLFSSDTRVMRCKTRDGAESKSAIVKYCDLENLPMHDKCGDSCCFVNIAHCTAKGIDCMEILRYGFL